MKNNKPKFSVCIITKNEEKTLPKLLKSLEDFRNRGGEIVVVDTGSTDTTAQIAKDAGCVVEEVGTKFIKVIDKEKADSINNMFIVEDEEPVVADGNKFFDFSEARNYCASIASNDMISCADADEIFTMLDIDKVDSLIEAGWTQFEYNFVYAHDEYGNEAIKFVQSKMYDRTNVKWTNMVHEVLNGSGKRIFLDEDVFKLEHFQIPSDHRSSYLAGLALDCYLHLDYDRNSHYFARELMWCGHPKSAIKEFKRHIAMDKWKTEKAQSYIFIGDCYRMLGDNKKQLENYQKSIFVDDNRREPFMKTAAYYKSVNKPKMVAAYVKAAMELPWFPFYANNKAHYMHEPHEFLYWARGWLGDVESARNHLIEALRFQPRKQKYLDDTKYYFEYPNQDIDGWMSFEECQWLYNVAKKYDTIAEIGSWKGRSTHALLSGAKGVVHAIDHFEGSSQDGYTGTDSDKAHGGTFEEFKENTKEFKNLLTHKKSSVEGSKDFKDNSIEMVFIDAGHTYDEVMEDIKHWLPKATKLISGHDYSWPGVKKAVDEVFGKPDYVVDTIWMVNLDKSSDKLPKVSIVIPQLGRPRGLQKLLKSIDDLDYPQDKIERIIIEGDETVPEKVAKGLEQSTGDYIVYAANDMEFFPDTLKVAINESITYDKGLVAFDTGVRNDKGYICEHFLIKKTLIPLIDGEIFDTDFHHVGVDDLLWAKCTKLKQSMISKGKVLHKHFSRLGSSYLKDDVINKGWKLETQDRALLKAKLEGLYK